MSHARTILVSGPPGTGKSTIRHLAPDYFRRRYGQTAAFDTDEFYTFFDPAWTMADRAWWYLAFDACLTTAHYLLQQGVTTILISSNGRYTAEDVNRALAKLQAHSAVYHITLDAPHDVVVERVRNRGDLLQHPPHWLADWQPHIRQHYAVWTMVLDTAELTPEAVLDAIYDYTQQLEAALSPQVA